MTKLQHIIYVLIIMYITSITSVKTLKVMKKDQTKNDNINKMGLC